MSVRACPLRGTVAVKPLFIQKTTTATIPLSLPEFMAVLINAAAVIICILWPRSGECIGWRKDESRWDISVNKRLPCDYLRLHQLTHPRTCACVVQRGRKMFCIAAHQLFVGSCEFRTHFATRFLAVIISRQLDWIQYIHGNNLLTCLLIMIFFFLLASDIEVRNCISLINLIVDLATKKVISIFFK